MKLTPEQVAAVRVWADEGAGLNEIQTKLKSELGLSFTFLDTRLLVLDLGIELHENRKSEPAPVAEEATSEDQLEHTSEENEDLAELTAEEESPLADESAARDVDVSIDVLNIPGTMLSGKVVFSDGVKASWYLDQYGRLGIDAENPSYRPNALDTAAFQRKLQDLIRKQGGY